MAVSRHVKADFPMQAVDLLRHRLLEWHTWLSGYELLARPFYCSRNGASRLEQGFRQQDAQIAAAEGIMLPGWCRRHCK
jgi:hypothetical protein